MSSIQVTMPPRCLCDLSNRRPGSNANHHKPSMKNVALSSKSHLFSLCDLLRQTNSGPATRKKNRGMTHFRGSMLRIHQDPPVASSFPGCDPSKERSLHDLHRPTFCPIRTCLADLFGIDSQVLKVFLGSQRSRVGV